MKTIRIHAIGNVQVTRVGSEILVSIGDLLNAFDVVTPAKVVAERCPAVLNTSARNGKRIEHFIDIAGACILVSTLRGQHPEKQLAVVAQLIDLKLSNAGEEVEEIREPRSTRIVARAAERRPAGRTVKQVIEQLGLTREVSTAYMGKHVSEAYQGDSERWQGGIIYRDVDQVAGIISSRAKQMRQARG